MSIFSSSYIPFLILPYSPFQKKKKNQEIWHNCLFSNWIRLLKSSKSFKKFQKNIAHAYIYQLTKFGDLMSRDSTDLFKMHPVSCTNTHRDVTDLVNHVMVNDTKTWISQEQNITFLWNKKILNLCLRWHILRSYRFAAEVTYN